MLLKLLALLMFPAAFLLHTIFGQKLAGDEAETGYTGLVKAESKFCIASFTLQGHVMSKVKIP